MGSIKKRGEYDLTLGEIYDKAPKSVLASIAVSFATSGGDHLEKAQENVLREWWILFENHIVSQRPPFPKPSNE